MIQLISGVTRVGNRTYSPADGPIALDDAVEKRLVSAGVARYLYADERNVSGDELKAALAQSFFTALTSGEGTEPAATDGLRGSDGVSDVGQVETLPNAESVAEGEETPDVTAETEDDGAEAKGEQADFYDADYLTALTNARLKEIAEGMDIDTSAMRKKADFVEAILQRQNADSDGTADDEEPPDLSAEEPVS